ncbi:hypothetical protein EOK75_01020 [Pseudorhodobacter turbinis]|uniref:Probable chemoreceptor glutamine deamidase CheD n=1 Tax=Pseudorhodobacter turbinis TaxID=2500533 RepID=A0A4P8ECU8_9RHOB|nr:chemotaxis protein CheD [Pseudorhodobacter turbinis]QCO54528.1 hypothetical protein EOK75_01020 [Pseudorhodobacter turbinis]
MDAVISDRQMHRAPIQVLHIVQGQIGVTDDPNVTYTALVGVGLVICLSDPRLELGGMAHCMFAQGGDDTRFSGVAIQALLQQVLDKGGDISRLKARLYGGAKLHEGRRDIGKDNAISAEQLLRDLNVEIVAQDIGRNVVRRVRFHPTTSEATVFENDVNLPSPGA